MEFNDSQKEAITFNEGACLVLAGPGSGKTTVLTQRVKYLVKEKGISPSKILVITFTKAAACEMKQRFLSLMGESSVAVTFGTFHAVFFTILKHAYRYSGSCIIKQDIQFDFVCNELNKLELEYEDEKEMVGNVLEEIGRVKNNRCNIDVYQATSCPVESFRLIYRRYESMLVNRRLIDFDDMILQCIELLSARADYREAWQKRYDYILIDEFQDINQAQFDVVRILAERNGNIFAVGDDDQSIYGFRGSKPDIMLRFKDYYPEANIINLDINYRCSGNILNVSKALIECNKNRYDKNIRTDNFAGAEVELYEFEKLDEEKEFLLDEIRRLYEGGTEYGDIAVLCRTNMVSGVFLSRLESEGIPCVSGIQPRQLQDSWIFKDILTYFRLALGNRDRAEFFKILNKPVRYISRGFLNNPVDFDALREAYLGDDNMQRIVSDLQFDLGMIRKMTPFAAVNYIRKGVGYDDFLRDYAFEHRVNDEEIEEILEQILFEAKKYNTIEEWLRQIAAKEKQEMVDKKDRIKKDKGQCVNFMTMHSAKGLEFKVVFVMDVCEGIIPYNKAVLEEEIEEERRMFYVAMTRAKEKLYLLYPKQRYNKDTTKSRFIEDIEETTHCPLLHINPHTP